MGLQKNFVVKNGFQVSNNLIVANPDLNRVGIGSSVPQYRFDVRGQAGISTVIVRDELLLQAKVSAGSTSGKIGQYLVSTGTGVTWASLPNTRKIYSFTANPGQTSFSGSGLTYIVGLIDVYVNGVRLQGSGQLVSDEFTATTGTTVVLDDACFGGETVEIVAYSAYNVAGLPGVEENVYTVGVVTALSGFISVGNTTPVQITLAGNQLTFTAVGIGSTTFTLS